LKFADTSKVLKKKSWFCLCALCPADADERYVVFASSFYHIK